MTRRGFAPASRRRNRIAAGVALAAIAVGANVLIYSSLNASEPAVQAVVDVPAGAQITNDMLRTVEVDAPSSVNLVPGDQLDSLVGSYAKVRLVSGSLVTPQSVQASPLVGPGNAVVAIQVDEGALPVGLRERVPVQLVIRAVSGVAGPGEATTDPTVIDGVVVALPIATTSALGRQSLSVEVAANAAPVVAAAEDVRVVLTEPIVEPTANQPDEANED
ncbi:MAG: SAF domain-containing protein [Ilumatobacteraceae bacterium]